MNKHELFPQTVPVRENEKIHLTSLALRQLDTKIQPHETQHAKAMNFNVIGDQTLQCILNSLNSLPTYQFEKRSIADVFLQNKGRVQELLIAVKPLRDLLVTHLEKNSKDEQAGKEAFVMLETLITKCIYLGEAIAEYNERIDSLSAMQQAENAARGHKKGAESKKAKYLKPLQQLAGDIVKKLEADPELQKASNKTWAQAMHQLLAKHRSKPPAAKTLQKYIAQARQHSPVGRPSADAPNMATLCHWLDEHFSDVNRRYFTPTAS